MTPPSREQLDREARHRAEREAERREEHERGGCGCEFPNECLFDAGYKAGLAHGAQYRVTRDIGRWRRFFAVQTRWSR